MYNRPIGAAGRDNWQTTFAWGRNMNDPGNTLDAFLLESAVVIDHAHTFFGRFENVEKDELFQDTSPLAGSIFRVNKLSVGYIYDFPETHGVQFGVGGLGSIHLWIIFFIRRWLVLGDVGRLLPRPLRALRILGFIGFIALLCLVRTVRFTARVPRCVRS